MAFVDFCVVFFLCWTKRSFVERGKKQVFSSFLKKINRVISEMSSFFLVFSGFF